MRFLKNIAIFQLFAFLDKMLTLREESTHVISGEVLSDLINKTS